MVSPCEEAPCLTRCRQGPVWKPRRLAKQAVKTGPIEGVKSFVGTAGRWVLQGVLVYTAVVALQGATGRKRLKEDLEVVKVWPWMLCMLGLQVVRHH